MDNDTMVAVTPEDYALAETVVHASNIVSHDGYYEVDIDRAAQAIARHRHQSGRTVPSHEVDADGVPLEDSDPWFQIGWLKDQLERTTAQCDEWKERAMSLRISAVQSGRTGAGGVNAIVADMKATREIWIGEGGCFSDALTYVEEWVSRLAALSQSTAGEDGA